MTMKHGSLANIDKWYGFLIITKKGDRFTNFLVGGIKCVFTSINLHEVMGWNRHPDNAKVSSIHYFYTLPS